MSEVISTVKKIIVDWISSSSLLVKWELSEIPSEDIDNYEVEVLRSYDQSSEYTGISGTLDINTFEYLDEKVKIRHSFRDVFYKVKITDPDGIESTYGPGYLRNEPDIIARDIIRRNNLLLEKKTGTLCSIHRHRTIGTKCPRCFDPIKGRKKLSNCPDCYNTGILHGYYDPVESYVNFNVLPSAAELAGFSEVIKGQSIAWLSNYPIVQPRDIIVDRERRWRVVDRNQIEKRGIVIRQILRIEKVNLSDIEYSL